MITCIDADEVFHKIQHQFLMKMLKKTGTVEYFVTVIKFIYLILKLVSYNGETLKTFPLRSGTK